MNFSEEVVIRQDYAKIIESEEADITKSTGKEVARKTVIPTSHFYHNFARFFSTGVNEILPRNCKHVEIVSPGTRLYVLEDEPRVRTVTFDFRFGPYATELRNTGKWEEYGFGDLKIDEDYRQILTLQLSFPYVIYIIGVSSNGKFVELKGSQLFFRLGPLTSVKDDLIIPCIPNIDPNGYLCLGDFKEEPEGFHQSYSVVAEAVPELFWTNRFNHDLSDNLERYGKDPYVGNLFSWAYFTQVDPMFLFDVKWLKEGRTLYDVLEKRRNNIMYNDPVNDHSMLKKIFTSPYKSLDEHTPLSTSENIVVCGQMVSIGDPVVYKDKEYYISGFLTEGRYDVILEDEDGGFKHVSRKDFEKAFESYLKKEEKSNKIESAEINGVKIEIGSFVEIEFANGEKSVSKVTGFRTGRDGKLETRMKDKSYLLDNLKFSLFDINNIEVNGMKLDFNTVYQNTLRDWGYYFTQPRYLIKFRTLNTTSSGNVRLEFENVNTHDTIYIDMKSTETLTPVDNDVTTNPVIRGFNYLYTQHDRNNSISILPKVGLTYQSYFPQYAEERFHRRTFIDYFESTNKERLYIPSFDMDIDLKIGDHVVVTTWEAGSDLWMLEPSEIIEFKINQDWLNVVIKKGEEVTEIPYINLYNAVIHFNHITKIDLEYQGLRHGDLIRASAPRIPCFPKSNAYTIVGFVDVGYEDKKLMLCSNGCTVWATPEHLVDKFDLFPRRSHAGRKLMPKVVKKIEHDKLRVQCGDRFYDLDNNRMFLTCITYNRQYGSCIFDTGGYLTTYYWREVDKYFKSHPNTLRRSGIILPRMTKKDEMSIPNDKHVKPNFFGGTYKTEKVESHLPSGIWLKEAYNVFNTRE